MPSTSNRRGPQTTLKRVAAAVGVATVADGPGGKGSGGATGRSRETVVPAGAEGRGWNSQNASVPAANQKNGPPGVFDVAAPDSPENRSAANAATSAPRSNRNSKSASRRTRRQAPTSNRMPKPSRTRNPATPSSIRR